MKLRSCEESDLVFGKSIITRTTKMFIWIVHIIIFHVFMKLSDSRTFEFCRHLSCVMFGPTNCHFRKQTMFTHLNVFEHEDLEYLSENKSILYSFGAD